ncbi:SRPBCC domain-containing protein [Lentzea tibetensis]|uniref:SRPBCC domain-containing protein n=1 Tax=Lentzea tibetensis TaxID=2591470 RepID=A0A563EWV3_9PSEU|nr:SRPBCC domain-containing protein [Lentzea tibetensis]TWP52018.1 SRPBCC domain-containing protein [Lentzea tibetensis]
MSETPRIEVTVAAPVEDVWDAMRNKEKIRHWHGWEDPTLEQEIDVIYFSDFSEDGHTLTLNGGGGGTFELTPDGDGTRLTMTRAPRGVSPEWDAYYDDITEGWTTFLHQLKFALERHPGEKRRTLFHMGQGLVPFTVPGETFFKSANQHGVVVPEWGDGLLITGYNAEKDQSMAVLTIYGFSDAELEALAGKYGLTVVPG